MIEDPPRARWPDHILRPRADGKVYGVKRKSSDVRRRYCERCQRFHRNFSDLVEAERIRRLRERDHDPVCGLCGLPIWYGAPRRHHVGPSVDHIVERSAGGCTYPGNLRLVHEFCNSARANAATIRDHPRWHVRVVRVLEKRGILP